MTIQPKRMVSVRLSRDDAKAIREVAQRLGSSDSEIVRFAIGSVLSLLHPLRDNRARGRDVLPVFLELGAELCRHFELDERRLNAIINGNLPDERAVDIEDIELLPQMTGRRGEATLRFLSARLSPSDQISFTNPADERMHEYFYSKYADVAIESKSNSMEPLVGDHFGAGAIG